MNYYEHHIGDYAEATAHLTFIEDAAYTRMIRKYYAQEKPLPADVKAVQRLVGARSKEEREAVETILGEFFRLEEDGWHNGRCDEELARYLDKTEGKDVKRENEKERQRRHRQRRKELFDALREHGEVPAYDLPTDELVTLLSHVMSRAVTRPVTRDATATQSPVTSHQSPNMETSSQASTVEAETTTLPERLEAPLPIERHVQIALLLRAQGVQATSQNPTVCVTWANDPKVTDEVLNVAITKAKAAKPNQQIPVNYLARIVEGELTAQAAPPPEPKKPRSDDWAWKRSNEGIVAKGRELGMFARGGESYPDFASRIENALAKRKGGQS